MEDIEKIYALLLQQRKELSLVEIANKLNLSIYQVICAIVLPEAKLYLQSKDGLFWYANEYVQDIKIPTKEDPLLKIILNPREIKKEKFLEGENKKHLDHYIEEIKDYRTYTGYEIYELFERYRNGDDVAFDCLVKSHLRKVLNSARHYKSRGVSMQDLIQEGNCSLIEAIVTFDYAKHGDFSTYSTSLINQGLSAAVNSMPYIINIPTYQKNILRKIYQYTEKFEAIYGFSPCNDEIAEEFEIRQETANMYLNYPQNLIEPTRNPEIEDVDNLIVEDENFFEERNFQHLEVRYLLHFLKSRERDMVMEYYGIPPYKEISMDYIAKQFGLSRERVRQIIERAILKLRARVCSATPDSSKSKSKFESIDTLKPEFKDLNDNERNIKKNLESADNSKIIKLNKKKYLLEGVKLYEIQGNSNANSNNKDIVNIRIGKKNDVFENENITQKKTEQLKFLFNKDGIRCCLEKDTIKIKCNNQEFEINATSVLGKLLCDRDIRKLSFRKGLGGLRIVILTQNSIPSEQVFDKYGNHLFSKDK